MKKLIRSSLIFYFLVISFSLNAQQTDNNSLERVVRKKENNLKVDNVASYQDFRFTIGGGYAHRLGDVLKTGNGEIDNMMDDFKNGFNIDLEGQYYFKEHWGLGLNIYFNRQSASTHNINIRNNNVFQAKESADFIYVGPTFNVRYPLGSSFTLYMNAGIGPLFFKDEATVVGQKYKLNKTVFASYVSVSGDCSINNNMGAGLKISVGGGTMSGSEFGVSERVSLSNFMITAFLSFRTSK